MILNFLQQNNLDEAYAQIAERLNEKMDEPLLYLHLGDLLFKAQDYINAEHAYNKAIEYDSTLATAYFNLGNVYSITNHYKDARKQFLKALKYGLNNEGSVYFMIGYMYFKETDYERALPYFLRAYELNEKDSEAYFQYGLALAKLNYTQNAKSVFEEVIHMDEKHSDALYNLGMIEWSDGQISVARNLFLRVLIIQEDHIFAKKALHKLQSV